MNQSELRGWVRNSFGPRTLTLDDATELVADIDGALGSARTAPADSPLGVELSKIRDRLNALEKNVAGHEQQIGNLELWADQFSEPRAAILDIASRRKGKET
jgi:hypothetical protein